MAGVRPRQPAYGMKFSTLNFSSPSLDPLDSRRPAHAGVNEGYPSKKWLFICCWLV